MRKNVKIKILANFRKRCNFSTFFIE